MALTISDLDYKEVMLVLGSPVVPGTELEFTEEDIKDFMILPALREYFIWFPITVRQSLVIGSTFSVDFPDEFTYGISDARINPNVGSGLVRTGSPFMNELLMTNRLHGSGFYGTVNDYGITEAKYMENAYAKSAHTMMRAEDIRVDVPNKKVTGSSTISGELVITWAKYSEDFNSVPFRRKPEVIMLARARVLSAFAMLRDQMSSDTNVSFNTSNQFDKATKWEEQVYEKWHGMSKVAIIRG